jgi:hypothetical protein
MSCASGLADESTAKRNPKSNSESTVQWIKAEAANELVLVCAASQCFAGSYQMDPAAIV